MKIYLILSLLPFYLLRQASAFGCDFAKTQQDCQELQCAWQSPLCTGTIPEKKWSMKKIFIYPNESTSQNPSGSPNDPFKDLSQALDHITESSIIYIVQDRQSLPITLNITKPSQINYTYYIYPIYNSQNYTINVSEALQRRQENPELTSDACILKQNATRGSIRIYNAELTGQIGDSKNATIFCQSSAGGFIVFRKVNITNLYSGTQFHLIRQYNGGIQLQDMYYQNSNAQFEFININYAKIYKSYFLNLAVPEYIIKMKGSAYVLFSRNNLKKITQKYSHSTFLIVQKEVDTAQKSIGRMIIEASQIMDSVFEETNCNMYLSDRFKTSYILGNTFKNINFIESSQYPLFALRGTGERGSLYHFQRNNFTNIRTRHTMLYSSQATLQMYSNNWYNISMIGLQEHEIGDLDFYYYSQVLGACVTISQQGLLKIKTSNFREIYQNCIATRDSRIHVQETVFNNSGEVQEENSNETSHNNQNTLNLPFNTDTSQSTYRWISIVGSSSKEQNCQIYDSKFVTGIEVTQKVGAISIYSNVYKQIEIVRCLFFNMYSHHHGGAISALLLQGEIKVEESEFSNNYARIDGGAIFFTIPFKSIQQTSAYETKFINSTFINNEAARNGGGIFITRTNFYFKDTIITKNQALNGGGVYLVSLGLEQRGQQLEQVISNLTISNNQVTFLGSGMKVFFDLSQYFGGQNLNQLINMKNNTIKNNNGDRNTRVSDATSLAISQISYDVATKVKVTLYKIKTILQTDMTMDYSKLIENKTIVEEYYSFEGRKVPENLTINIKSGSSLPYILEIIVLNQESKKMIAINREIVKFRIYSKNQSINKSLKLQKLYSKKTKLSEGKLILKDQLKFNGPREGDAIFEIKTSAKESSLLRDSNFLIDLKFNVKFIPCELGEIYNSKSNECEPCISGTYSIFDPYDSQSECITCAQNANCQGGHVFAPQQGYYRYDQSSNVILKCDNEEACQGGVFDEIFYPQGKCHKNYGGNLCGQCQGTFAKFGGEGECVECKGNVGYYMKFASYLLIQLFAISLSIILHSRKSTVLKLALIEGDQQKAKKVYEQYFLMVLLRITVSFFLMKGVVNSYGFKWPGFVGLSWKFLTKFLPTSQEGFSIDCFAVLTTGSYTDIYFIRLVMIALKPILIITTILGIQKLIKICRQKKQQSQIIPPHLTSIKDKQILVVLCVSYITQTEVVRSSLNLFKCTNFSTEANPIYFLDGNPEIQCYTGTHLYWLLFFSIPLFLIWEILLPYTLYKQMKLVEKSELGKLRYLFLISGFKENSYYWEFVNLYRKDIIVLINVFFRFLQPGGQALLSLIILLGFLKLHIQQQPYKDYWLNLLETLSQISTIMILIAQTQLFFKDVNPDSMTSYCFIMVALLSSATFIGFLIYCTIKGIRSKVKYVYQDVKKKIVAQKRGSFTPRAPPTEADFTLGGIEEDIPSQFGKSSQQLNQQIPSSQIPIETQNSCSRFTNVFLSESDLPSEDRFFKRLPSAHLSYISQSQKNPFDFKRDETNPQDTLEQ